MQPFETREDILTAARECFSRGATLRTRRERYKRFTFGDQWSDPVADHTGRIMTELELASRKGRTPLTNNLIRKLVRTVVGRFICEQAHSHGIDKATAERNSLAEIDARALEEFLISGMAIQRISDERRPAGSGVWIDNVNPARFFCSMPSDPRCSDIELAGMLHDWSMAETAARFAGGNRSRAAEIMRLYGDINQSVATFAATPQSTAAAVGRGGSGRCRVIEIWTLEATEQLRCHDRMSASYFIASPDRMPHIDSLNRRRARRRQPAVSVKWELSTAWHGRWITPRGEVLGSRVEPRHPFALRFYPLVDCEVHSFVEDVIDQQKYVNRLITQVDNMMSTSAKGVLLFPQDELGDGVEWSDVTREWTSYDGVIPYNPRPGSPGPHQVVTNAADCGAYELLALEMKMLEEVSGVTGAYMGKHQGGSGNSAQLYEAQVRNSSVAMADIMASFAAFRADRDALVIDKESAAAPAEGIS